MHMHLFIIKDVYEQNICWLYELHNVLCNDNIERILVLARKFKGRNKRDNTVAEGGIVLIGKREFEVRDPKKKEHVDLLYVYSPSNLSKLKKDPNFRKDILLEEVEEEKDNGIEFSNVVDTKIPDINMKIQAKIDNKKDEELDNFDFDDI